MRVYMTIPYYRLTVNVFAWLNTEKALYLKLNLKHDY